MLYKTDIANLALGRLGVSLIITDVDTDNSQQAKIIRRYFRMSMDTLLELHPWSFATQYKELVLEEEDPTPIYRYAYRWPTDCLIIRQLAEDGVFSRSELYEDQKERWEMVYSSGTPIFYSNVANAHAKFTTRVPDTILMPNHFGRALSAQLAMDIAPSLITNNYAKIKQTFDTDARVDITRGISDDLGRQPLPEDSLSPFHRARLR